MTDITCAHCGEPWDVHGLRHEAVEYLDGAGEDLTPLGAAAATALDDYRTAAARADADGPAQRYARQVNDAVYRATLSGKGCPACGWLHAGPGLYRQRQLVELVFDGVTDDDPTEFLDLG